MRKLLVSATLFLGGCSAHASNAELENAIHQHAVVISAIGQYLADLQDKGVLPKVEQPEDKK